MQNQRSDQNEIINSKCAIELCSSIIWYRVLTMNFEFQHLQRQLQH
jgi:hypothetical protein